MQKLNKQDLYDILYGCTILGTGGGGSLEHGLKLIDKALAKGKEFKMVSLEEAPAEGLIACPYMCGSISPLTEEQEKEYAGLPTIKDEPALKAYRELEEYAGREFYAAISTELGGANTAIAFYTAAMLDKYIIDADPAGRSVPELQHSTYFIDELSITPMAVANEFGDTVIVKEVVDDFRAEALVRSMAVVSKNSVGVVDHLATAERLKTAVIEGAITYALKIGRAYRESRKNNEEPAQKIAQVGGGYLLFKGSVKDFHWEDKDGFTIGDVEIEGQGEYEGSSYKIWYKNENIIAWKNGEIDVTVPDLICMLSDDTGEPVTNPGYRKGMNVAVIGLPSPAEWRTDRGMELFGPQHFGYNLDYMPIEEKY